MRVLLVSANRLAHPHPVYPIGLDYVEAALAGAHRVWRTDLLAAGGRDGALAAARELDPDVIGVSLRNLDNTDATDPRAFVAEHRDLVAALRERCRAVIVIGGAGFTIAPEAVLAEVGADLGLLGEGERLVQLVDALAAGRDGRDVPGVLLPGEAAVWPPPLPALPRRRVPADPAALAPYLSRGGILNLQTKRGCPFRCCYCTYPHLEGRRIRRADPGEVADVARELQAAGARFLFVTDAVFNSDEAHGVAVAEALRRAGVTTPWGAFFAPRTTDPEYWRSLAASGLTHVEFGTEALAPRMLEAYRKPFDLETARRSHAAALQAGLHVAHYFMLGGPTEDEGSVRQTFAEARRLERCVCFFFPGVRVFPGTDLWDTARAEGQIAPDADPLVPCFYAPGGIPMARLHALVAAEVAGSGRFHVGAASARIARVMERLYALGHTGPLWERLVG